MGDRMEKTLRTPILVGRGGDDGSTELRVVTLRTATGRDLRKLDEIDDRKPFAQSMLLVEVVTGLDADAVDQMDGSDIIEIAEEAEAFLPETASPKGTEDSGERSSQTLPGS
jgi:hypothetical protein